MSQKQITKRQQEALDALVEAGGNISKAARIVGISRQSIRRHMVNAGYDDPRNVPNLKMAENLSEFRDGGVTEKQKEILAVYNQLDKSVKATSKFLEKNERHIQRTLRNLGVDTAETITPDDYEDEKPIIKGSIQGRPVEIRNPPKSGVKRYILTCGQNNTAPHYQGLENLKAYAKYVNAELFVGTIFYNISQYRNRDGSEKRGSKKRSLTKNEDYYDETLIPYFKDHPVQLAPDLMWCGHMQMLPTASNPFSRLKNYRGPMSCIVPHSKIEMQAVANTSDMPAKHLYSTGSICQKNYTETKTGAVGEWHHSFGALIVEVDSEGDWFVRQLWMTEDGTFEDIDPFGNHPAIRVENGVLSEGSVVGFQAGDIHVRQLEKHIKEAVWGDGGLVDALRPSYDLYHDLLDFESQNHHNSKDYITQLRLKAAGRHDVEAELKEVAEFMEFAARPWKTDVVVESNHNNHLIKWLNEHRHKSDLVNSRIYVHLWNKIEEVIAGLDPEFPNYDDFHILEYIIKKYFNTCPESLFLKEGDPFRIMDIECGLHGDKGANGGRGSITSFSNSGVKLNIGHSHSAGIKEGVCQSGVTANLIMSYNRAGLSSWSRSHILIMGTGKRMILTMRGSKYKAGKLTSRNKATKQPNKKLKLAA